MEENNNETEKKKPNDPRTPREKKIAVVVIGFAIAVPIVFIVAFIGLSHSYHMQIDEIQKSQTESTTPAAPKPTYVPDTTPTQEYVTPTPQNTFEFSDGEFELNEVYVRYTGTITNMSDETHYFVKVKGTFTDDAGNSIDTDWTYAVGDEGLAPGESTKFTLAVAKDQRISHIDYEVYDYR